MRGKWKLDQREVMESLVQAYRETGTQELRDELILLHVPLVRKLAGAQSNQYCTFDDLCSVGYCELVEVCTRAHKTLHNTDITPYISKSVRLRMLRYRSTQHDLKARQAKGQWRVPQKRFKLTDIHEQRDQPNGLGSDLQELVEYHTHKFQERMIIVYILYGHSIGKVSKLSGVNFYTVKKLWTNFVERISYAMS